MLKIIIVFSLSFFNLAYAIIIYLSLHGWLVAHDPSGMQLMIHLIITTPILLICSIWFYILSSRNLISPNIWKINLIGFLIPIVDVQTGVTFYHYDLIGLSVAIVLLLVLIFYFIQTLSKK